MGSGPFTEDKSKINGVRSIYRIEAWDDQNIEAGEWAGLIVLTETIQTAVDLIA